MQICKHTIRHFPKRIQAGINWTQVGGLRIYIYFMLFRILANQNTFSLMQKKIIYILFLGMAFLLIYCNRPAERAVDGATEYLNLNDTVDYIGMQTCRSCHQNVYETYIHTGMGQSFDHATKTKSAAKFDKHAIVYDPDSDFYYKPYWEDSTLYIKEFRLENGDTTHSRTEQISYVIGSGQHTNSHLIDENGYVYQAPITFYTQDGKWDMAPGFEGGANSRFSRIIATECMTCHNHLPDHVAGSENKYKAVPRGIECERCHGPGELHVKEKLAGNIIDTSKYVDYSIVNPANLPVELEVDICQRCHLQGTAVLNEDKTFFDFRPGMKLNEVMNVFLPRYTNAHDKFIMASQADRMRLSKCFTIGKLSCTTCHNPHYSIKATAVENYNNACMDCHQKAEETLCTAPQAERVAVQDNCVSCHMPKSGSIDIPHVRITDHFIGKPVEETEKNEIARFIGLECLTKENPSPLEMARGYIALYEKFVPEAQMLDSAGYYLQQDQSAGEERFRTQVHYYFTKKQYPPILSIAADKTPASQTDAWTAYRIGEAYAKSNQIDRALGFYQKAVELSPYNLDFQNKLGTAYLQQQDLAKARQTFEFILSENSKQVPALNNIGYIYLLEGKTEQAYPYFDKALALDPDYELAMLNKVGYLVFKKEYATAKKWLNKILKKNPDNQKAKQMLGQLNAL